MRPPRQSASSPRPPRSSARGRRPLDPPPGTARVRHRTRSSSQPSGGQPGSSWRRKRRAALGLVVLADLRGRRPAARPAPGGSRGSPRGPSARSRCRAIRWPAGGRAHGGSRRGRRRSARRRRGRGRRAGPSRRGSGASRATAAADRRPSLVVRAAASAAASAASAVGGLGIEDGLGRTGGGQADLGHRAEPTAAVLTASCGRALGSVAGGQRGLVVDVAVEEAVGGRVGGP